MIFVHLGAAGPCRAAGPAVEGRVRAVRVVIDAEPAHLNPIMDPDLWGYRIAHDLICEPLVRRSAGGGHENVLAERVSVNQDATGVAVALRKGVRFHDGRLLTAHDVRFTLEQLHESAHAAPRTQALLADLYKVEVLSPQRLQIELRRPAPRILDALAEVDILPEHLFSRGSLLHQPQNRRPVCTGPYVLAQWRHGRELVLRRNPAYWGAPPAVEELHFLVTPDAARGLMQVRRGAAELLGRVPPLFVPDQVEPATLHGRLEKVEVPADQVLMVLWNARRPALEDPRARRGLSLLLDRRRLVQEVRHGLGEPLLLPPPLTAARDTALGADVAQAEALLEEAGLHREAPDGPRSQGGRPLRLQLLVPAGSSEALGVARRMVDNLGRAGIRLDPEVLDLAALQGRLRRSAFDAALLSYAWTGAEGPELGPLLRHGGGLAFTGAETGELDGLLDALHRAADPERRRQLAAQLAALLLDSAPLSFLYRPRQLLLADQRLHLKDLPPLGDFPLLRALRPD